MDIYSGIVIDVLGDFIGFIKFCFIIEGGGFFDIVYVCGDIIVIDQFSYGFFLVKDCWDVYNGLDGKIDFWYVVCVFVFSQFYVIICVL